MAEDVARDAGNTRRGGTMSELPLVDRGMILGKFMPPTQGHRYLAEFARRCCKRLSVLVCR